jgi:hypothetical protein
LIGATSPGAAAAWAAVEPESVLRCIMRFMISPAVSLAAAVSTTYWVSETSY